MDKNKNFNETILSAAAKSQVELNDLLQKLIQTKSYSGEEREIVEFISGKCRDMVLIEHL